MNTLWDGPTVVRSTGACGVLKYSASNFCVALLYCHTLTTALLGFTKPSTALTAELEASVAGVITSLQPRTRLRVADAAAIATVVVACAVWPVTLPTYVATIVAVPAAPPPYSVAVAVVQLEKLNVPKPNVAGL